MLECRSRRSGAPCLDGRSHFRHSASRHSALPCPHAASAPVLRPGSRHAQDRPRPLHARRDAAAGVPARTRRPEDARDQRAVPRPGDAAGHPGPLRHAHAVLAGRAARAARHPHARRHGGRDRPAEHLAAVRRPLPPVSRHADRRLAEARVRGRVRHHGDARQRQRDGHLRPHRRVPGEAGVPAPRALRALQHRGALHDRRGRRHARAPQGDARRGLGLGAADLPAGHGRHAVAPVLARGDRPHRRADGRVDDDLRLVHPGLESRRAFFKAMGATATDHAVVVPYTERLPDARGVGASSRGRWPATPARPTPIASARTC